MPAPPPVALRPGDCLLYTPKGWIGWVIAIKTWHRISHVEVFDEDEFALASRDGIGVNRYHLRLDGLCAVLRPNEPLNWAASVAWFDRVARHQKYDYKALLRFLWPSNRDADPERQICSAFATRLYRAGGFAPFAHGEDADLIAPASFLLSPHFDTVWKE